MTAENNPPGKAVSGEFVITRVFNAPRPLVFRAWTEADQLARWFGPKGCVIGVARMDLRPGGVFLFSMRTQDGTEMWGKWVFREIVAPERLVLVNSFSDAKGGLTRHPANPAWPPEMLSTTTFAEQEGGTSLTVRWVPLNPTEKERGAFDGGQESMKIGWTGTLDQLEAHLVRRAGGGT